MWDINNSHPKVKLRSHSCLTSPKVPVGELLGLLGMFLLSRIKSGVFVCSLVQHYHGGCEEETRDKLSRLCRSFLAASVAD